LLYANVLDQTTDTSDFANWLDALERKALTTAEMVVQFSKRPAHQAQVIGSLQAGPELIAI
jgi:hypothetical protein